MPPPRGSTSPRTPSEAPTSSPSPTTRRRTTMARTSWKTRRCACRSRSPQPRGVPARPSSVPRRPRRHPRETRTDRTIPPRAHPAIAGITVRCRTSTGTRWMGSRSPPRTTTQKRSSRRGFARSANSTIATPRRVARARVVAASVLARSRRTTTTISGEGSSAVDARPTATRRTRTRRCARVGTPNLAHPLREKRKATRRPATASERFPH